MAEEGCIADVPNGGRSVSFHRCRRSVWKGKWCKQHHPEIVEVRDAARRLKWAKKADEQSAQWERQDRISAAERAVIEAACEWRDDSGIDGAYEGGLIEAVDVLREART